METEQNEIRQFFCAKLLGVDSKIMTTLENNVLITDNIDYPRMKMGFHQFIHGE